MADDSTSKKYSKKVIKVVNKFLTKGVNFELLNDPDRKELYADGMKMYKSIKDNKEKLNKEAIMAFDDLHKFMGLLIEFNKTADSKKEDPKGSTDLSETADDEDSDDDDSDEEDFGISKKRDKKKKSSVTPVAVSIADVELVKKPLDPSVFSKKTDFVADKDSFCKRIDVLEMKGGDLQYLINFMQQIAFEGFNWKQVFNNLRKNAEDNGISKEIFISHMRLLCAMYVERGSNFINNLENLENKDLRRYLLILRNLYKIVKRERRVAKKNSSKSQGSKTSTSYNAGDVTINRIVAIFADLVAQIIKANPRYSPPGAASAGTLPLYYKFPAGASLLPNDLEHPQVKEWMIWYKAFGKVINQGVEQSDEDIKKYAKAINSSNVFGEEIRKTIRTQLGDAF